MDMVPMPLLVEWEDMECNKDHLHHHQSLVDTTTDNPLLLGDILTISHLVNLDNLDSLDSLGSTEDKISRWSTKYVINLITDTNKQYNNVKLDSFFFL